MRLATMNWGDRVWFNSLTGVVRGEKKWSETHVTGGGGAGTVSNGYGSFAPTSIISTVKTRHEFWVVGNSGQECCVTFGDSKLNVRDGQTVTVLWGAKEGKASGPYLLIRRHGMAYNDILNNHPQSLLDSMGLEAPGKWHVLTFALIGILASVVIFNLLGSLMGTNYQRHHHYSLWWFPFAMAGLFFGARRTGKQRLARWESVMIAATDAINADTRLGGKSVPL